MNDTRISTCRADLPDFHGGVQTILLSDHLFLFTDLPFRASPDQAGALSILPSH